MINVIIYGKRTSSYHFLLKYIKDFLVFNHLEYSIEEIQDVNIFIKKNVRSIPYVVINNEIFIDVKNERNIKVAILKIFHSIIRLAGEDRISKIIIPFSLDNHSFLAIQLAKSLIHDNHLYSIYLELSDDISADLNRVSSTELDVESFSFPALVTFIEEEYIANVSTIIPISRIDKGRKFMLEVADSTANIQLNLLSTEHHLRLANVKRDISKNIICFMHTNTRIRSDLATIYFSINDQTTNIGRLDHLIDTGIISSDILRLTKFPFNIKELEEISFIVVDEKFWYSDPRKLFKLIDASFHLTVPLFLI